MPTCQKCNSDFPNRLKINNTVKNLQNRKFCLSCTPYGEHNTMSLKSIENKNNISSTGKKTCTKCKKEKELSGFYDKVVSGKKIVGGHTKCRRCLNDEKMDKFRSFYKECVAYKGGCCSACGFSKDPFAMEFHGEADVFLTTHKSYNLNDVLKEKLDKTVALCSNCHKSEHRNVK